MDGSINEAWEPVESDAICCCGNCNLYVSDLFYDDFGWCMESAQPVKNNASLDCWH